jgi:hypothetical protein
VRSSSTKKKPQAGETSLGGHQDDGDQCDGDAQGRPHPDPVATEQPDDHRHRGGRDGGDRCEDAHHPGREGAEEHHQARAAHEPGCRAPGEVGHAHRPAEPGEQEDQREQAGDLGERDDGEDRLPAAGQPAQEVGGAVDECRGQRQQHRHAVLRPGRAPSELPESF